MKPFNYFRTFLRLPAAILIACLCVIRPALATVATWNGADANWTAADNWNLSPAFQGDEKYYPQNDNPYGARYEAFIMSGRVTLTLSPIIDAFHLSGGTLAGSEHTVTTGEFYWSGGVLAGGVQADGGVHIGPVDAYIDGGRLTQGKDAWGGLTSQMALGNGATFKNEGMLNISSNWIGKQGVGVKGTFENTGVVNVSMASSSDVCQLSSINLRNTGTINVLKGRLGLTEVYDGTPMTGEFALAAGTQLAFYAGDYTLDSTCKLTGAGTVNFSSANFDDTVTVDGSTISANPVLNSGVLKGTFATSKRFVFNGGTLAANLTASGGMDFGSALSYRIIDGVTVMLPAAQQTTLAGPTLTLKNGAVVNNAGTFTASGGGMGGVACTFNNAGVMDINLPTSSDTFYINQLTFHHTGTVNVNRGKLALNYSPDTVPITGAFNIASGAELRFDGSYINYALAPACTVAGAGIVNFSGSSTTITIDGSTISANPVLNSGTLKGTFATSKRFVFNGGTLAANLTANGGMDFGSALSYRIIDGVTVMLPAGQQATLAGPTLTLKNGAVVNNAGTFTASSGSMGIGEGAFPTFNNQGTFNVSLPNAADSFSVGPYFNFNNTGLIDIKKGKMAMNGTFTQSAGTLLLNGGSLAASPTLSIGGGSLAGSGDITGTVILQSKPEVSLVARLGGTTAGGGYDRINILSGNMMLGGELLIHFTNDFQKTVLASDTFTLLTVDSIHSLGGSFLNVASGQRINTSDGYGSFLVRYGDGAESRQVVLSDYIAVPEPSGLAVLGLAALALKRRRRTA